MDMESLLPFHGSVNVVDGSSGGGSNSVGGGLGNVSSGTPMRVTNMAGPCVRKTLGVYCSIGSERGDEWGSGHGGEW